MQVPQFLWCLHCRYWTPEFEEPIGKSQSEQTWGFQRMSCMYKDAYTVCMEMIYFFFILPSCFLWLRHEGNKIFTQDELGWSKMISSIFICTICSVLISFHSFLMLQIYSANKSNEWPEFTFKSQETWTACIYWNNTVIATAFSNKLLTGLTEV